MRKADSSGLIASSFVDGEDGVSDDGGSRSEGIGSIGTSRVGRSCGGAESESVLGEVHSHPIIVEEGTSENDQGS